MKLTLNEHSYNIPHPLGLYVPGETGGMLEASVAWFSSVIVIQPVGGGGGGLRGSHSGRAPACVILAKKQRKKKPTPARSGPSSATIDISSSDEGAQTRSGVTIQKVQLNAVLKKFSKLSITTLIHFVLHT